MPKDTPVTIPVVPPTVAIAGADEVHKPPGAASVRDIVAPPHTLTGPVIVPELGAAFTVTTRVAAVVVPQLFVML